MHALPFGAPMALLYTTRQREEKIDKFDTGTWSQHLTKH
jgi:hypothetical protein